ncbi:MAG: restriction endonuclease subunit S [Thermoguttaceae bacterium]|nr:restriction endonuclease subunit S [Thermoguttaceae bacterium]MBQ6828560.1 restriction endonuclease subunit S [Thermoguttaceae bacterium]
MKSEIKGRIAQIRRGVVPSGYRRLGSEIVPSDWTKNVFAKLGVSASKLVDPKEEPYLHMPYIGAENIERDTGRILPTQTAEELGLVSGKFCFDSESIVYSRIRPNLNKVCVPTFVGICSSDCSSIKPTPRILKDYLFHLMQTRVFGQRALVRCTGTGMPRINREDLNGVVLCYPPHIEEQRRIAEILTTQDKIIALKERRLAEKRRQKTFLAQRLLTGKTRLPGFDGEWQRTTLGAVTQKEKEKNTNFQYSLVLSNSAQHGIVPQSEQFSKEIANEENIDRYYIVRNGFFVYNPRISVTAPCGPIHMNETGNTGVMSPLYTVFSIRSVDKVDVLFLKLYLESTSWHKYMKSVANYGARHDRMNVSDDDFFLMPIPLPNLKEQQAIAEVLTCADREIETLQRDLELEKRKKKALMQLLLTGVVRVNSRRRSA